MKEQLRDLLDKGFIRLSVLPWGISHNICMNERWFTLDVYGLLAIEQGNYFKQVSILRIDDLFDQLHGASYFSKIDLQFGHRSKDLYFVWP